MSANCIGYNRKDTVMIYTITFAIGSKQPDYDRLTAALRALGDATPALPSVWLLDSPYDANQIFEAIGRYLAHEDRLFVAEITDNSMGWIEEAASYWLSQKFGLY